MSSDASGIEAVDGCPGEELRYIYSKQLLAGVVLHCQVRVNESGRLCRSRSEVRNDQPATQGTSLVIGDCPTCLCLLNQAKMFHIALDLNVINSSRATRPFNTANGQPTLAVAA